LFSINDLFNFKNESILQYHIQTFYFFQYYEIIKKYHLIKQNSKILEMSNLPSVFEACYYYQMKKYNAQSSYTLDYFNNFTSNKFKLDEKDYLAYYSQYYKMNINYNDIKTNLEILDDNKYNLIFANIYVVPDINIKSIILYQLTDYINYNLYIIQLYYALIRLELDGSIVFPVLQIRTKYMADLVLLVSSYFEKYHLYMPETQNKYKWSSTFVIYKHLKTQNFDKLKKTVNIIIKNNITLVRTKFPQKILDTIPIYKNEKIDDKYIDDNQEFIKLLDYDIDDAIYTKIKKYNEYIYFIKLNHIQAIYDYTQMSETTQERQLKKQKRVQIITGLLYAKKWGFKTIPISHKQSHLEKLILSDMFSLYKPILFEFTHHTINNMIDIPKDFFKQMVAINMADYTIDTRNIYDWDKIKSMVRFYRPYDTNKQLRTIIEKKFNQKYISQAWIKMYEMIDMFNLIPKDTDKIKTFHMCEAPGNFISAINHYIKTQTKIKNFDWYAQTLNPNYDNSNGFKDDFNYIKNYSDKWIYGNDNTGNIMNTDNIKFYKKYTLERNIQLLTSDCGMPDHLEKNEVIKLHIAQLIFILYNLQQGGKFVAKLKFPLIYSIQFNMIYKCYSSFDKLYFFKGHQNPASKEFYIIGVGYNRDKINSELEDILESFNIYDDIYNNPIKLPTNTDTSADDTESHPNATRAIAYNTGIVNKI
jgi:23S rRNA U2552 (ribose-2'-O)-methylase RlmE/FtsJ